MAKNEIIYSTVQIEKKDLFDTIINLMKGEGWEDISSNSTSDFIVLHSKGIDGDKDMYIQMSDAYANTQTYSMKTTGYSSMQVRLAGKYIPGEGSTAGSFEKTSEPWRLVWAAQQPYNSAALPANAMITLYYYVDKNGFVGYVDTPQTITLRGNLIYLRNPEIEYCPSTASNGLVIYHSEGMLAERYSDNTANTNAKNSVQLTQYCILSPTNPNLNGEYAMSELLLGNTSEGVRFKINELYFLPAKNILHGDEINVGDEVYKVFSIYTGLPSTFIAMRVE